MKHPMINTFRRITLNGKAITLCISFSSNEIRKIHKSPLGARKFDSVMGIWRDVPFNSHTRRHIKQRSISGGIALINIPMDTAKEYIDKIVKFLQYAYVSGGAILKLKDEKSFSMRSKDKKKEIAFTFAESNAETAEDMDEYVVPIKGKIKLDSFDIKTLIAYFTNTEHFDRPEF